MMNRWFCRVAGREIPAEECLERKTCEDCSCSIEMNGA